MAGRYGDHCRRWPACGPARAVPGRPGWVVPAVTLALLAVLIAGDPGRIDRQKAWLRGRHRHRHRAALVVIACFPNSLVRPLHARPRPAPVSRAVRPGPAGRAGSEGTRPRVARCSASCHLQFSEDSGALSPGEPYYPPSAPSTLGRNRDGTIPGSRPGEGRLPGGRSTDRAAEPRFPGHARPGPAIGPARHPAGLAQGRRAVAVPGAGRPGRGRSIWR